MLEFEEPQTQAVCLTGVQDHPDDWNPLRQEIAGSLALHRSVPDVDINNGYAQWIKEIIDWEIQDVREQAATFIFAHSHATHRAPHILEATSAQAGILICPPSNRIGDIPQHTREGSSGNVMERMMCDVALDMSDKDFVSFCERHHKNFKREKSRIGYQINFLKNGPTFSEIIEAYHGNKPILALYSEQDPWNPRTLPKHCDVRYQKLSDGTGHYPHVSKAYEVATMIRNFCREIGLDLHSQTLMPEAAHV